MKIKVIKSDLRKAITSTRIALSKIVILEERGHLLFEVIDQKLSIKGTNSDFKAKSIVDLVESEGSDFSFTADPKILDKLLLKMDIDEVSIDFNQEDLSIKIYTSEDKKSFSTLQSFYPDKMLKVPDDLESRIAKSQRVNKEALIFSLKYLKEFLPPIKEDHNQFDNIVIDKGHSYAANGSNKIGFVTFKTFEKLDSYRIRKSAVPLYATFLKCVEDEEVLLIESDKEYGVSDINGVSYFSFLKSSSDTLSISKEYIKSSEPYITISKKNLQKTLERLLITHMSSMGAGINFSLNNKDEECFLEATLISNNKSIERIPCKIVGSLDKDIDRLVLFDLFKSIIWSLNTEKDIRLHIIDNDTYFKTHSSGEVDGNKYILTGVGTYAKKV